MKRFVCELRVTRESYNGYDHTSIQKLVVEARGVKDAEHRLRNNVKGILYGYHLNAIISIKEP